MTNKRAVYDVEFKALPDNNGDKGRFEALVSVFGNVDVQGDRVMPGAFEKSIAEWRAKGKPIPVIWSHDWGNPNAHIGFANPDEVEETDQGLKVAGQIDLDNPFAAQVHRLLKEHRVSEFSFAYDIRKEKRGKDGANELHDLGIIEAGPTLKGANPSTELLAVKSDLEAAAEKSDDPDEPDAAAVKTDEASDQPPALDAVEMPEPDGEKAGRRISRATESELRGAISTLRAEIDRLEGLLPAEGSDDEKSEVEDEAPAGKSSDDANLKARLLIDRLR